MKPLLSIMIPVAPNRMERLKAILSRLSLNQIRYPDHTFEVIVCDGGATDGTKALCLYMAQHMKLKYVYVPINRFINAAYPRNIMLRMCEGQVISMIDIDHWPSEDIIYGMLNPLVDDKDFRFVETDAMGNVLQEGPVSQIKPRGQYTEGAHNVLNRGYVIDSSTSAYCAHKGGETNEIAAKINAQLLTQENLGWEILDVYKQTRIPHGVNNTLWIWAAQRAPVLALNGYDEIFCRKYAYSREDDDWRERLKAQITGNKQFTPGQGFFDGQNRNFCAIHLWHPAAWRGQDTNNLNKVYYPKVCQPVRQIVRNRDWQWGKLIKYSFSIIDGVEREVEEHEGWVAQNVPDMPAYHDGNPDHPPCWETTDAMMEALEQYVK